MDRTPKGRWWSSIIHTAVLICLLIPGGLYAFFSNAWVPAVFMSAVLIVVYFIFWSVFKQFEWQRFKMKLSTAIILMIVAGGLLWLNMRESGPQNVYVTTADRNNTDYKARVIEYGWPFTAAHEYRPLDPKWTGEGVFSDPFVVWDFGVAIGILYVVWFICDGRHRRAVSRNAKGKMAPGSS